MGIEQVNRFGDLSRPSGVQSADSGFYVIDANRAFVGILEYIDPDGAFLAMLDIGALFGLCQRLEIRNFRMKIGIFFFFLIFRMVNLIMQCPVDRCAVSRSARIIRPTYLARSRVSLLRAVSTLAWI